MRSRVHRDFARLLALAVGIMAAVLVLVVAAVADFGLGPFLLVPVLVISFCMVAAISRSFPPGLVGTIVALLLAIVVLLAYMWIGLATSGPWD